MEIDFHIALRLTGATRNSQGAYHLDGEEVTQHEIAEMAQAMLRARASVEAGQV